MNAAAQSKHLAQRQKVAAQITAEPNRFMACDQCNTISLRSAHVCSVCGCYRFNTDAETVRRIAADGSARPFPVTVATAPRIPNLQPELTPLIGEPKLK